MRASQTTQSIQPINFIKLIELIDLGGMVWRGPNNRSAIGLQRCGQRTSPPKTFRSAANQPLHQFHQINWKLIWFHWFRFWFASAPFPSISSISSLLLLIGFHFISIQFHPSTKRSLFRSSLVFFVGWLPAACSRL